MIRRIHTGRIASLSLVAVVLLLAATATLSHNHTGNPGACQICHTAQSFALVSLAFVVVLLECADWRMQPLALPFTSEPFLHSHHSRAPPA
jgi:hypothetical protein